MKTRVNIPSIAINNQLKAGKIIKSPKDITQIYSRKKGRNYHHNSMHEPRDIGSWFEKFSQ